MNDTLLATYTTMLTIYNIIASEKFGAFLDHVKKAVELSPWQKKTFQERGKELQADLEERKGQPFTALESELQNPHSTLMDLFKTYMTTEQEDKVQYLKNALLNGVYGDIVLDEKIDFIEILQGLKALDIQLLSYIFSVCPNYEYYLELCNSESKNSESLMQDLKSFKLKNGTPAYNQQIATIYEATQAIDTAISFKTIVEKHPQFSETTIERSLSRLESVNLIYNDGANRLGSYNPTLGYIPYRCVKNFLKFVSES
jgi:hypothetical protein